MEVAILAVSATALALLLALVLTVPGRVAAGLRGALGDRLAALERGQERVERSVREEAGRSRDQQAAALGALRGELGQSFRDLRAETAEAQNRLRLAVEKSQRELVDSLGRQSADATQVQTGQLELFGQQLSTLTAGVDRRLDEMRKTVDEKLGGIQAESAAKLEQMRQTVDEKLQGTLEKRLGESFRVVSEHLESVQRGLGEMQALASGVGDLKKVLGNVKVRGSWGEIQLGTLLEQILTPEQYATNVATRPGSSERVEFAVRLPGQDDGGGEVMLPIDAKFPLEDWQRLVEASERGDAAGVEESGKQLELRIKGCAKDIRDKYVSPPHTTDFGILFLPTEALFAEVTRRGALLDVLRRDLQVVVAGPTTLSAILNSLQMGFRTLAIQKRSSEVWKVLGAVKVEFGKFGGVIEKVEKKLEEASNQLGEVGKRRRVLERALREVQELPALEAQALLPPADPGLSDPL